MGILTGVAFVVVPALVYWIFCRATGVDPNADRLDDRGGWIGNGFDRWLKGGEKKPPKDEP